MIARNLHVGVGEADLVCVSPDGRLLVIAEVKTRTASTGERRPESQVGQKKQAKLRSVAMAVRNKVNKPGLGMRIDVIAVELARWPRRSVVRHIEHAVSW